jgi:soluble lytic murein transglycosylase
VRIIATALLLALSTAAVYTQRRESIRASVEKRDFLAALVELKQIENSDAAAFKTNNLDYLAARLHQGAGDLGRAALYFEAVRSRKSILREYAIWHLASIAREQGNTLGERLLLLELIADRPGSLLARAAQQRIAESHFESKNFDEAIASAEGMIGEGAEKMPRELELLLAKALLFKGDPAGARIRFEPIIATTANPAQPDDLALESAKALDLIEIGSENFGINVAILSDSEHLKRATIYQFNRDFADARLHFQAIVNNHPTSGLAPEAVYQIGRGYSQTSDFSEAVKWYERVAGQYRDHPINKDALLQLASGYARLGRHQESVARYERFIQNYPGDERLDRAYLNIVDVLRDAGEETDAISRAEKAAEVFRGKAGEAQAIFVKARMRIARSEWEGALSELDRLLALPNLGGAGIPGGTTRAEVTFLRGVVLQELRRYPEAINAYLSIPDGRNEYYGWRATEKLQNMPAEARPAVEAELHGLISVYPTEPNERRIKISDALRMTSDQEQRKRLLEDLKKTYADLQGYRLPALPKMAEIKRNKSAKSERRTGQDLAAELAALGLYDEAAPEYEASTSEYGKTPSPEVEYTLARIYLKGDRADRAVAFMESFVKLPADFQSELMPLEIAEMLYPQPYSELLTQHATSRSVDPHFVLSIMRQESRFRANVKSVAAARGLMQFIPDTSNRIAGELGRDRFDQNELYEPSTAVLFGSQYVGNLFRLFPNQPDAVAASYNGGEENMQRWYGRARSDQPGRYVPEIAFAQTKDYVWRVMANYRMYKLLYSK